VSADPDRLAPRTAAGRRVEDPVDVGGDDDTLDERSSSSPRPPWSLNAAAAAHVAAVVAKIFREEGPHLRATLVRQVRDLSLVDDAISAATVDALASWPTDGVPSAPGAWLTVVARRRLVDALRRHKRRREDDVDVEAIAGASVAVGGHVAEADDDDLALVFGSCHPSLNEADRVALTLQAVGGLRCEEVARAFLVPVTTMEKRLARAKAKLRRAGVSFTPPPPDEVERRLPAVLSVVYLIFNEGYLASRGDALVRLALCDDAIRLGRVLRRAAPRAEVLGLLALMLLTHARRETRTDGDGALVLLEHQDRSRWDAAAIAEGVVLLDEAMSLGQSGPFQIQAAIAALHAEASSSPSTDWAQIAALYAGLLRYSPSPVVRLNHAVAMAMAWGPDAGLSIVEALGKEGSLDGYHLYWSTRGELMARRGDIGAARRAFQRAKNLAKHDAEKRFLAAKLVALSQPSSSSSRSAVGIANTDAADEGDVGADG
jgi:RNA polymerase sigma-70 factor (ECF subfamily)